MEEINITYPSDRRKNYAILRVSRELWEASSSNLIHALADLDIVVTGVSYDCYFLSDSVGVRLKSELFPKPDIEGGPLPVARFIVDMKGSGEFTMTYDGCKRWGDN